LIWKILNIRILLLWHQKGNNNSQTYKEIPMSIEKTSLDAHVELCALRYSVIENRLTIIEQKVSNLQTIIEKSHMNMIKVLLGTAGTVIAGVLSTVVVILTNH